MRSCFLRLLCPLLLFAAYPAFSDPTKDGLHLAVGYAVGQMQLEGGSFQEQSYLSSGIATSFAFGFHPLPLTLGVKSIGSIGAHSHDESNRISEGGTPLRRFISHVSLSPYLGYRWDPAQLESFGLLLEAGPGLAISTLRHKDDYAPDSGLQRKKSTFTSRGYELALGLYQKNKPEQHGFDFLIDYQFLRSERQYLVDITQSVNAQTLSRHRAYDIQDVQIISAVIRYALF